MTKYYRASILKNTNKYRLWKTVQHGNQVKSYMYYSEDKEWKLFGDIDVLYLAQNGIIKYIEEVDAKELFIELL